MGETPLGRVLDPEELSSSQGARGRVRAEVPEAWLTPGTEIDLTLPARIVCARCSGGGCDGCDRSGALRTPDEASARTVRVPLPEELYEGAAVRLVRPFGELVPIDQLIVELRLGSAPSQGVARVAPQPALFPLARPARARSIVVLALALASAAAAAWLGRGC